jgi:hypothetical protein
MSRPIIAWSFSAYSDFNNCAYKYYRVRVAKDINDTNQANAKGDDDHKAFENYVGKTIKLPEHLERFKPGLDKLKRAPGHIITEGKFALDQNYNPCDFKDWQNAWVRAITDYSVINGTTCATIDYKFGKPRKDSDQNALVAAVLMHTYPQLQLVKTAYWYALHDKWVPDQFTREDIPGIWNRFLPTINKMVQAKQRNEWPKTPNPLCAWCPVHDCQWNKNPQFMPQGPT